MMHYFALILSHSFFSFLFLCVSMSVCVIVCLCLLSLSLSWLAGRKTPSYLLTLSLPLSVSFPPSLQKQTQTDQADLSNPPPLPPPPQLPAAHPLITVKCPRRSMACNIVQKLISNVSLHPSTPTSSLSRQWTLGR